MPSLKLLLNLTYEKIIELKNKLDVANEMQMVEDHKIKNKVYKVITCYRKGRLPFPLSVSNTSKSQHLCTRTSQRRKKPAIMIYRK